MLMPVSACLCIPAGVHIVGTKSVRESRTFITHTNAQTRTRQYIEPATKLPHTAATTRSHVHTHTLTHAQTITRTHKRTQSVASARLRTNMFESVRADGEHKNHPLKCAHLVGIYRTYTCASTHTEQRREDVYVQQTETLHSLKYVQRMFAYVSAHSLCFCVCVCVIMFSRRLQKDV